MSNITETKQAFPKIETQLSESQDLILLGTILAVGLTFIPLFLAIFAGIHPLIGVVLVGGAYGVLVLLFRRLLEGAVIGLSIVSLFAADVPLAGYGYLSQLAGHLGPRIWLYQLPLAAVVVLLCWDIRDVLRNMTKAEYLFSAFVGWSVIAAVFGATKRMDAALYYSLFFAHGALVCVALRHVVQQRLMRFRTVVYVVVIGILCQCVVAVLQFVNGGIFGLSMLGEAKMVPIATVSLGSLGTFYTGTHVEGFTGMAFNLASLVVIAIPVVVAMAVRERTWQRWMLILAGLVMVVVVRATGTDAGKGSMFVSLGCLFAVLVYQHRGRLRDRLLSDPRTLTSRVALGNMIAFVFTVLSFISIILFPSSDSGSSSVTTDMRSAPEDTSNPQLSSETLTTVNEMLQQLSIPFFDLSYLGIRVQQYASGMILFLKHPVFGIGGANYSYYSVSYGLPESMPLHNMYIALLAETGLSGFILYMLLLGMVFWCGWSVVKRDHSNNVVLIGLLCGFVGYLAFGFWDILQLIKYTSYIPFWILAGAIIGEYARETAL